MYRHRMYLRRKKGSELDSPQGEDNWDEIAPKLAKVEDTLSFEFLDVTQKLSVELLEVCPEKATEFCESLFC